MANNHSTATARLIIVEVALHQLAWEVDGYAEMAFKDVEHYRNYSRMGIKAISIGARLNDAADPPPFV